MKAKNLLFPRNSARSIARLAVLGMTCLFLGQQARAATYTYTNTTSNTAPGTNWNDGTNWTAIPASASDTTLSFTGTLAAAATIFSSNDISGNFQLNAMSFAEAGPATGTVPTVAISGNALEFVNNAAVTPVLTFNTSGTVKPTVTINNNLVLTNNLTLAATTAGTLGGVISGTGSLTKTLGGSVLLGNANTYTGGTTISQGTLSVSSIGNQNASSSSLGGTYSTINIGGAANQGQITYTGVGESTDRIINLAGTTGGAQILANGTGALVFSGNLTATGVGAKTLTLNGTAVATLVNSLQGTIGDSSSGATSVTKTNVATWFLSNTTNSFTGTLTNNQGSLQVATISNTGLNSSIGAGSAINLNGNSSGTTTLAIVGAGGATNRTITINSQSATNHNQIDSSGGNAITLSGPVSAKNTATVANNLLLLGGTSAATFQNLISGAITDSPDGTKLVGVTKSNTTASWVLSGPNTYSSTTIVSGGVLAGMGANAFGNTSGISIAGAGILSLRGDTSTSFVRPANSASYAVTTTASGATINTDQATVAGTAAKTMTLGTLGTTSTLATFLLNFTGANNTSLSIGAVTGAASTAVATVTIANAITGGGALTLASFTGANTSGGQTLTLSGAGNTTITGAITPSATALALTCTGAGIRTLSGTSSYTGPTTISTSGTLNLAATGSLAATAVAVNNTGTLTGSGSIGGSVAVASGGHLAFAVAANPGAQDPLNITGLLNVMTGSIIDLSTSVIPVNGNYTLALSSVPITYTPGTVNLGGITGSISLSTDLLSLVLTVTSGASSAYDTWAKTTHGLSGANADFNFDYDNDGLANGIEWILGGNPTTSTPSVSPVATRDASNNLILTFTRQEDSIGETILTLEYGSNLTDWTSFVIDADGGTDANGVIVAIDQVASPDAVTVTIPASVAVNGKIFSRIKAVKAP